MAEHDISKETELLTEVDKCYEKYRESPGWIEHCLHHIGVSDYAKSIIAETIGRLPKEVKEFVCKKCLFISVKDGLCLFEPGSNKEQWIIILSEALHRKDLYTTTARTIAYAWLQRNSIPKKSIHECKDAEEQTVALLAYWGIPLPQE
jgi:hypothetical protein